LSRNRLKRIVVQWYALFSFRPNIVNNIFTPISLVQVSMVAKALRTAGDQPMRSMKRLPFGSVIYFSGTVCFIWLGTGSFT